MAENNEKRCRICLKQAADSLSNVFNINFGGFMFVDVMNTLFGMKIDPSILRIKNVPKQICSSCHEKMIMALELRKLAWESFHHICDLKEGEEIMTAEEIECTMEDAKYEVVETEVNCVDVIKVEDVELESEEPKNSSRIENQETAQITPRILSTAKLQRAPENLDSLNSVPVNVLPPAINTLQVQLDHAIQREATIGDIKKFTCDVCSKQLQFKSYLIKHLHGHFNIRNFNCRYCQKSFVLAANLKRHTRSHTGEKPFSCPKCKKKFSEPYNLADHLTTHSDEKLFGCAKCSHRCKTRTNANHHVKRCHGISAVKDLILKF